MTSGSWFDDEKLLAGERLVRSAAARLRTDTAPLWWEGNLILTTDRLFFLPLAENPLIADVAFWVRDIAQVSRAGRNRLFVFGAEGGALFQLLGSRAGVAGLAGWREAAWVRGIMAQKREGRARRPLEGPRRAAG